MNAKGPIRAVAFREGDVWIVHGVEYDIVTQIKDPLDAPVAFLKTLVSTMLAYQRQGKNALESMLPAPKKFEELFDKADVMLTPTGPLPVEDRMPRPDITLKAYRQSIGGEFHIQ